MWHWMYLLFDLFYSRFPSRSVSLCEAVRLIACFVILGYLLLLIFIHHGGQAPQWATALLPAARFFFVSRMLCFPSDKEFGCIVSWYTALTCFVFWFQTANRARKQVGSFLGLGSSSTRSNEIFSHSSSDNDYSCHRQPTTSTVPANPAPRVVTNAVQSIDIIEQQIVERGANIKVTLEEIQELKNRLDWTEHLLNNIFYSCHGKPIVTCMAMQAP